MRARGFTLIELIVVVALIGVLAVVGTLFIRSPVQAYADLQRRQTLVDGAELALRRVARDVRRALPNSLRDQPVGAGWALELIPTVDAARYRAEPIAPVDEDDFLRVAPASDDVFNVMGRFENLGAGRFEGRLAIYNTSEEVYGDAAGPLNPGVISGAGMAIADSGNEHRVTLDAAHSFEFASPAQRVFAVDDPISYVCAPDAADPGNGTLTRHEGYGFLDPQPAAPPGGALVVRGVAACGITYQPGSATRAGLVTVELTLVEEGEQVSLLHQIHVVNAP